ncbi:universal stress protein [Dyella sp.]|jgi:nucleotide-binding universal stress UspA family protein|uniref:universal stress protein n=1 Tax=Dyella sp. TaxID=1869338 RepID=UPI002D7823A0|nr:universal stress protein [Dyella sp.]HET6432802.1 universal stress protein [Dyella sp.]
MHATATATAAAPHAGAPASIAGTGAHASARAEPRIRDVLTYCPDFRRWSAAAYYAAALAAELGASLTGLHAGARLPYTAPAAGTVPWLAEWAAHATDEIHCAMLASRGFAEWARAQGVGQAYWQVALGDTRDVLDVAGNTSDLLVLDRQDEGGALPALLHGVLLSGHPCIVVPPTPYISGRLERVVVGWDGSPNATRSLHAALPLLHEAGDVVLLYADAGPAPGGRTRVQPPFDPQRHLRAHGVAARRETLPAGGETAAHAVLAYASHHRADLLVIGAHGKPRRSESCLDDPTHLILRQAQMPLFVRY